MKNILVVKLSAIGDVIHALPVSYAIKETYPDAHLTWVVEPTAYPILEDNPYIDDIILFEKAKFRSLGGFLHAIGPLRRRLRRRRYDASLDLQGLFKSAAIVFNARVKRRIGTANMREGANLVSRPVKGAHAHGHIVERYLDVARALGCRVDEVRFPVAVSARDANAAEIVLAREGVPEGRRFIALAIGANWPNKRWPAEHFAALSDRLYRAHYIPVLVGGGRLDVLGRGLGGRGPATALPGALRGGRSSSVGRGSRAGAVLPGGRLRRLLRGGGLRRGGGGGGRPAAPTSRGLESRLVVGRCGGSPGLRGLRAWNG